MGSFATEFDALWRERSQALGRTPTAREDEDLACELFERWVAAGRFDEAIRRVHREYGLEGGLHECIVLGHALRAAGDGARLDTLFEGLLARRKKAFWQSWPKAEAGDIAHMLRAARLAAEAMTVFGEYTHSLRTLGRDEAAAALHRDMLAFQARQRPGRAGPPKRHP